MLVERVLSLVRSWARKSITEERMRKALGFAAVVLLLAMPAAAQKVNIDYSHDFDFDDVKTFQYVDSSESDIRNEMMHDRIVSKLKQALKDGGLTEVTSDPDLLVTYHATSKDQTVYNTTNFGYGGYHGGWYGWGGGMGTSTTTASNYTEGTLIFDAYDPVEKKMVWRGTGTVTVKAKPDKQSKQIDNILEKLGKRWDKIVKEQGK
jgi:hypothetical protein